ncbi:MAG: M48 family metalloprotease [Cyclobacteriaceae bacterium]
MKKIRLYIFTLAIVGLGVLTNCGGNDGVKSLFFSIDDDKSLGLQVSQEIESDAVTYPILSEIGYPEAYAYLNGMKDDILTSSEVAYRDEFVWQLKIIDADILNAFATPGGYIYVYTGLINYLENADDLAGVLGHEIAHADRRHSIKQLEKAYGIQLLLSIALGDSPSQLEQIAAQIATAGSTLKFSRDNESEADEFSVKYLADTEYACNGAASFFSKLITNGQDTGVPEFLSTHPNPDNRVEDINGHASTVGCSTTPISESGMTYEEFKLSLP